MLNFILGIFSGLVIGLFVNRIYESYPRFTKSAKSKNFQSILNDRENWSNNDGENYFYSKDPSYKIIVNEGIRNISPRFSKFPDRNNDQTVWVQLKYVDSTLYNWNFMYLDGARILIPVPDSSINTEGNHYDYYNLNDNYISIFRIIGSTSGFNTIENIAEYLNIEVNNL